MEACSNYEYTRANGHSQHDERPSDEHVYLALGYLIQKLEACTKDYWGEFKTTEI